MTAPPEQVCTMADIRVGKDGLGWWAICRNCGEVTNRQPDKSAAREAASQHTNPTSEERP